MFFNSRTLYLGADMGEFNRIRDILDREKIEYKQNITDHNSKFLAPGEGVVRSLGVNPGSDKKLYEILVSEKDYEQAEYVIRAKN